MLLEIGKGRFKLLFSLYPFILTPRRVLTDNFIRADVYKRQQRQTPRYHCRQDCFHKSLLFGIKKPPFDNGGGVAYNKDTKGRCR